MYVHDFLAVRQRNSETKTPRSKLWLDRSTIPLDVLQLTYEYWYQNRCNTPIAFINATNLEDVPASHIRTLEYARKVGEAIIPKDYKYIPGPLYQTPVIPLRSVTPLPLNETDSDEDAAPSLLKQKAAHFTSKQKIASHVPELGPIPTIYSIVQNNQKKTLVEDAAAPKTDTSNMSFWELLVQEMNQAPHHLHPCVDPSNYMDYGEAKPNGRKTSKRRRGTNPAQKRSKTVKTEMGNGEQEGGTNVFDGRNAEERFPNTHSYSNEQPPATAEFGASSSMNLNAQLKPPLFFPPAPYYWPGNPHVYQQPSQVQQNQSPAQQSAPLLPGPSQLLPNQPTQSFQPYYSNYMPSDPNV
ncbi:hypothetical protein Y032_0082g1573 [Ancylostoma ceylanicum]|nr:hypothetical protein Y032_0082g1573 [Ancylostoma ceylanicum]